MISVVRSDAMSVRDSLDVHVRGVTKRYGIRPVLRSASLHVRPGEALGLIGSNGAGKTTLLRILLGLVHPDSGEVTIGGLDVGGALGRHTIAYFGGVTALPPSVRVATWSRFFRFPRSSDLNVTHAQARIGRLSRGQRRLLGLRTAIGSREPGLIILDEPWEGLDLGAAGWLNQRLQHLSSLGATIITSSPSPLRPGYGVHALCGAAWGTDRRARSTRRPRRQTDQLPAGPVRSSHLHGWSIVTTPTLVAVLAVATIPAPSPARGVHLEHGPLEQDPHRSSVTLHIADTLLSCEDWTVEVLVPAL